MCRHISTNTNTNNKMLFKNPQSSMESSLSKITFIYQAVGLQFFSVNAKSLEPTSGLSRKQKLFLIFNFTLFIGEFCAIMFIIYNVQLKHSGVETGRIVQFSSYGVLLLVISVSMLNNLFLRGKAKETFKNCNQISEILSVLNQDADYSPFENEFKITMTKLFFGYILSNIAFIVFIYQYNQKNFLFSGIILVYPYFFLTALVSYWTLLVRLIGLNLRFMKKCLASLDKKHKLFSLYPEPYNHDLRIRRTQETYNFIVKLKRMYAIVYDSTTLVNELIGIPICVYMVLVVLSNISGGYAVFLSIRGDVSVERIAIPLCTIYTSSITLCTLIFSCSSTYNTVDDILSQVHKFEFKKFEREAGISSILLEFACQVVQRPIEFKVCGFYCLNQPLLATIITGILTYAMLLVQFYTPSPK